MLRYCGNTSPSCTALKLNTAKNCCCDLETAWCGERGDSMMCCMPALKTGAWVFSFRPETVFWRDCAVKIHACYLHLVVKIAAWRFECCAWSLHLFLCCDLPGETAACVEKRLFKYCCISLRGVTTINSMLKFDALEL